MNVFISQGTITRVDRLEGAGNGVAVRVKADRAQGENFDQYIRVIGWGAKHQGLANLKEGSRIWFVGKARVGRPYQLKKGERAGTYSADQECHVNDWNALGEAPPANEEVSVAEADYEDPFTN